MTEQHTRESVPAQSEPTLAPPAAQADPAPLAGPMDAENGVFTPITPGLILSTLDPARAVALAHAVEPSTSRLSESTPVPGASRNANQASRLLALLNDAELRRLARVVGMPTDGHFISLYHRLALLC